MCVGALRVFLTDACALCWRGRCSSRFPPGRAGPPCPASWGFWAANSWPAGTSAETCCTDVTASAPITWLAGSFLNAPQHSSTADWLCLSVPAPRDSRCFQSLIQNQEKDYSAWKACSSLMLTIHTDDKLIHLAGLGLNDLPLMIWSNPEQFNFLN